MDFILKFPMLELLKSGNKDLGFTLVESDQRKCAFLRNVARETSVKFSVISDRAENLAPHQANILSARALAPLSQLLSFAELHLSPKGRALFLKGKRAQTEIQQALEHWSFDCKNHISKTDRDAVILNIGDIKRA